MSYSSRTARTFVNDVVVTKDSAWFTDSMRAVSIACRSRTAHLGSPSVPLTGDFQLVTGFNLNGIDATPDGKTLVVVQTHRQAVQRRPATGTTTEIDLGGAAVPNGDGLLLHGRTLYVVQNQLNRSPSSRSTRGSPRGGSRGRSPTPTSTCPRRSTGTELLYAVNARFGTAPGPSTTYSVVQGGALRGC